jgi:hypothetical protein
MSMFLLGVRSSTRGRTLHDFVQSSKVLLVTPVNHVNWFVNVCMIDPFDVEPWLSPIQFGEEMYLRDEHSFPCLYTTIFEP